MLTPTIHAEAAERLIGAAVGRKQAEQLTKTWPGISFDDAYAIQSEVIRRRMAAGAKVIGHKIGLTSKAMQRSSGIDEPDYGVLLDDLAFTDGAKIKVDNYCVPRVEVELAFVLAKPLKGPGIGVIDVLRATEFVVPSLELIDARVRDPRQIFDTISDNGAAAGVVLGGRPVGPREVDLRWVGAALYKNGEIEETGLACGVMGHPARAIAWLANKLGPHGIMLEPEHTLLAGSFTRPVWVAKGDVIQADFGPLGNVAVQFI
jgi:2-oxo-hept-3-ene-1,7-dioate hydratase